MNAHLHVSVRRLDGRWRITARDRELEHTHFYRFATREHADRVAERVRKSLDAGGDLNLVHWEYSGP